MITVKTTLKNSNISKTLKNYDIDTTKKFSIFNTGTVQTNILVHTTYGRFVLRYYERNRSFNAVLFEANLIKYLKKKNYPRPKILRNRQEKLVLYYKGKPYLLRVHMLRNRRNTRNNN